jgi:hypothetical protein
MRRKRRTAADWREVLSAYEASGLSGVAFCQANGIGQKSFYRARGQYGSAERLSSTRFVQVAAKEASSVVSPAIELVVPCGTIRMGSGVSPMWVADLVKSLSA